VEDKNFDVPSTDLFTLKPDSGFFGDLVSCAGFLIYIM